MPNSDLPTVEVLDGYIFPSNDLPPLSPNITEDILEYSQFEVPGQAADTPTIIFGNLIRGPSVPQPQFPKDGYILGSFRDDYYDRILVIPQIINVGNLTVGIDEIVEVFNAFTTPVTLTNIIPIDAAGIEISGYTLPETINGLDSLVIDVAITTAGPPVIDATFQLIFSNPALNTEFKVIGVRVVSFPYYFSAPSLEILEWRTNILVSENGIEQRVRTRRSPRQEFQGTFKIQPEENIRVEQLLYGFRAQQFSLPVWSEGRLGESAVVGQTVLEVDPRFGDFRIGGLCVIWNSAVNNQISVISDIDPVGGTITIEEPLALNYSMPIIAPARTCRFLGDPVRRTSGFDGFGQARFQVQDNIEFIPMESPGPFPDGYPVHLEEPDKGNNNFLDDSIVSLIQEVDSGSANAVYTYPWLQPKIGRRYRVLTENLEQLWNFRQWLHARSGRLKAFYMPTFENNFRLTQEGPILTTFTAVDDFQGDFGSERIHIGFNLTDGSWVYRTIALIELTNPGEITVTIDTALNIDSSDIVTISYVGLKRLNSDRIQIRHLTNCVSECQLSILEIAP